MSGRRGYRSQRRPQVMTTTCATMTPRELAEASAPEPKDCPRCDGAGTGCGACGGLGFLAGEEWRLALQLAFVAAAGLVLPCSEDAA